MSHHNQNQSRHDHHQHVENAINDVFGKKTEKAESDLDQCYRYGTEMNHRVQQRLAENIKGWIENPLTKPNKSELFVLVHKFYLDDIATFKPSKDQLQFLFAFNCAKILIDGIFQDL